MLQLTWIQAPGPTWYQLDTTNFAGLKAQGVYVIWITIERGPVCVDVGQGVIADRLYEHQNDPQILQWRQHGTLYVTWAGVQAGLRDGVERYLADYLQPLAGRRYPDVVPIPVNAPAAA